MKVQVKTTKVQTEEKEIKLPYFFKHDYYLIGSKHFAIFSKDKSMEVTEDSINCYNAEATATNISHEHFAECSEAEFTEAFETTMERIQSMMPVTN